MNGEQVPLFGLPGAGTRLFLIFTFTSQTVIDQAVAVITIIVHGENACEAVLTSALMARPFHVLNALLAAQNAHRRQSHQHQTQPGTRHDFEFSARQL